MTTTVVKGQGSATVVAMEAQGGSSMVTTITAVFSTVNKI
jgi:hypothetical protein